MANINSFKNSHYLTKTIVFGLLICSLLFSGGAVRRKNPVRIINEAQKTKEQNQDLKEQLRQSESESNAKEKETKKLDDENTSLKTKIKELEATNDKQQAAMAALKSKMKKLETTNQNQLKVIQKYKKLAKESDQKNLVFATENELFSDNNDVEKLSQSLYGVYLREKIEDLKKRFAVREEISDISQKNGESWGVEPNEAGVSKIAVKSYQGNVYQIAVSFKDTSEENFSKLKADLLKTYGRQADLSTAGIASEANRQSVLAAIDDVSVYINLAYERTFGRPTTLELTYLDIAQKLKMDSEIKNHIAQKAD